ncbi:MAG: PRD domain-containing protein [Rothia sp. (in: high G+C Gram-positive bacteria)]|uniref:PRD domain-containing protein n=1 Tax=Rothia sp. (in: high G+C Gram-positive bacteria) TaxID=1885016 RepID=UPI0026DF591A|nr:PRD domain-containing protein [Rothia sp. (in: high G+C Gram-positive bacteria)]MDO5749628.1 PRD domain-containing protein [Rothia sp. (in: high G+C Gram-positive bacteria)]
MRISRIYNNNIALLEDSTGKQSVVMGRGIAFGKRKGDMIDPSKIEQTFVPEQGISPERLSWSLTEIPADILSIATQLEAQARADSTLAIANSFILPLADHLHYALIRAREGTRVQYPLEPEVTVLYPREVTYGRQALQMVAERTGVRLDSAEAIPLALHLVNAQFATADMSRAFRMTEVFAQVFEVIESAYGRTIDSSSISAARFITHLRYLFVRADQGKLESTGISQPSVLAAVRADAPEAFACAQKVLMLLEMQMQHSLREDELTYLTIHIDRLAKDIWG